MTTFKAILFLLSCFTFVITCTHILIASVNASCRSLAKSGSPESLPIPMFAAALSFTYIMSYLFIW